MAISDLKVIIRGGGEIASAVAYRLAQSHFRIVMTETYHPEAVRRNVSFCEAVYDSEKTVEDLTAKLVHSAEEIFKTWQEGKLALIIDPETKIKDALKPDVLIDATMAKRNTGTGTTDAPLVIGLGVGFTAGEDVHVIVETNRGHNLGRVIRQGQAEPDTGKPGVIGGYSTERVLRAPREGIFKTVKQIGDMVQPGDIIAYVEEEPVITIIPGVIRGLLRNGTRVHKGMKSGDVDPRGNLSYCYTISDKGRAVGGGVLEAIMAYYNQPQEKRY
jgi:xanthine dehydrogenase accessory factor